MRRPKGVLLGCIVPSSALRVEPSCAVFSAVRYPRRYSASERQILASEHRVCDLLRGLLRRKPECLPSVNGLHRNGGCFLGCEASRLRPGADGTYLVGILALGAHGFALPPGLLRSRAHVLKRDAPP